MLPYIHSGIFPATLNTACRRSKKSAKKTECPLPRLLLLRRCPSSGVWKNEGNGESKGHGEREAKPSLSALMSWSPDISPSISVLRPPLAVAS